jgi:hypothetical protein
VAQHDEEPSEGWRYIRFRDGTEELYDERNDPLEWATLADKPEHAPTKEELASQLPQANAEDAPHQPRKRQNRQQG